MTKQDLMNNPDLSAIESRTYQTTINDGIGDLVFGLGLLALGISWAIDGIGEPIVVVTSFFLLISLWKFLRHAITEPRIGRVELHPRRMERLRRAKLILVLAFVFLPILLLPTLLLSPESRFVFRVLGQIGFGATVIFAGYLLEAKRLYAYGALMITLSAMALSGGIPHEYATITAGAIVTLTSLALILGFMRRHPEPLPLDTCDV